MTDSISPFVDHVVEVQLFLVEGGMSEPSPVLHYVTAAEEFEEVSEIALAGFVQVEALGLDALAVIALLLGALVFDTMVRTAYFSHGRRWSWGFGGCGDRQES